MKKSGFASGEERESREQTSSSGSNSQVKRRAISRKGTVRRRSGTARDRAPPADCSDETSGSRATTPNRSNLPLPVEKGIDAFLSGLVKLGVEGLRQEFAALKGIQSPDYKTDAFLANKSKNRYRDVFCTDPTRVVLTFNVPPDGDYIHANTVVIDGAERNYIAAQGPTDATVADFWRMVYQLNVGTIVMLCKVVEDNKAKCAQYFPMTPGKSEQYGVMEVDCKKAETEHGMMTYTLEVLPDGYNASSVIAKIYQMTDWPDRSVPKNASPALRLLEVLPQGQVLIHCSAGIGRTGTIIAIDSVCQRLMRGIETTVGIFGIF
uniref:Protein-tyrosine phosphatase n=1 Tax=Bursaphelenchus xylophilus TaxID=6326 RepID=A0A1I7RUR6_BURXY